MENSLYIRTSLSIGLCAMGLLFASQSKYLANMSFDKAVDDQTTIEQSAYPQVKLDFLKPSKKNVRLVLKRRMRQLYVYKGNNLKARYPVAVGRAGLETPIGKFKVIEMLKNPDWTNPKTGRLVPPGKDNPLGDRWIAFWNVNREYIGFHGTPDRTSVGKAISAGCVRLYNEDVRELYEMVKIGTPVIVEH
ncbi:L,D-transpeptidase [Nostoc sp. CENA543]|uniref:L,D-transpeptidase n=1 Tax=Nostoc sp. CENA543 TaxID=1869241 RepID=UPI000CA0B2E4|nr:L,D-transpeptidase [Nostoc sp. CENA543]AUT01850.1 L,D-transpeptidase [Nostoc sp. CENA543]